MKNLSLPWDHMEAGEEADLLEEEQAGRFRAPAARANYLGLDPMDVALL